jgi:DNA-directed RNA polymerase subunit H (RpoH/RPB5)
MTTLVETMIDPIQLESIEINGHKVHETLLTNVVKMLTNRKLLNPTKKEAHIANLLQQQDEHSHYIIHLDNKATPYKNKIILKIIHQKLQSNQKSNFITQLIQKNEAVHIIIIVDEVHPRIIEQLQKYTNLEIFLTRELLIHLLDHELVPQHIELSEEESNLVLEQYNINKQQLPKILSSDPVVRYYNFKVGTICKILRYTKGPGISIYYRLVTAAPKK